MRPFRSLLLAALVLAPAAARAADVPVTYTADTTALKLAISGTNLTFQLYTDGACTSLAHTQVLTVDNTNLLSVLKRSKPKNGVKPPKTTDVRATLTGVAPAAPIYLKVTGTGITRVGGACQVQASTAGGPGTPVVVIIKDVNGNILGPYSGGSVILSDGGTPVASFPQPSGFVENTVFRYASGDCSGPKLSYANNSLIAQQDGVDGNTLYYGPLTAPLTPYNSYDYAPEIPRKLRVPGPGVQPAEPLLLYGPGLLGPTQMDTFGPPSSMDISGFTPPFTGSFQ